MKVEATLKIKKPYILKNERVRKLLILKNIIMKNILKVLLAVSITIGLFNSCSDDDTLTIDTLKKGYWNETVSFVELTENGEDPFGKLKSAQTTVEHSISINNNKLNEYVDGHLIAEIPFEINGTSIIIYHPENENIVLSEMTINDDNSITNPQGIIFSFIEEDINTDVVNKSAATMDLCLYLCKATHRTLGLPQWVDSICCFWYPN